VKVADFDYELPTELIAQVPLEPRDAARLLVLDRSSGQIAHRQFRDLPGLLRAGDCLVANDSRVMPGRLMGRKVTGGVVELLLLGRRGPGVWEALIRPGRRVKPGTELVFGSGELTAVVRSTTAAGGRKVEFQWREGTFEEHLKRLGRVPLPPYIHTDLPEPERYQTVYSREPGSAAAPTAGLHFTPELLERLEEAGIGVVYVTLHVGLGTFRPVQAADVEEHIMHVESYAIGGEAAAAVNRTRDAGGRVIAVGTTAARVLETRVAIGGNEAPTPRIEAGDGETGIFIYPGYRFRAIDGLITNFHLPKSTLLMLVAALAGRERVLAAYREAIRLRYRFFSFGDAMLVI
jgi:S-adenosylmethionine:tRNA ribosyltransferase-isomerase